MDDRKDLRLDTTPAARWLADQSLRPVHNLNRRLFEILIDEAGRGTGAAPGIVALGSRLTGLEDEVLWRLAAVPVSWIDAEFRREELWSHTALASRLSHALPESPVPRGRALELAGLTFGLAATTAQASREAASIIFGMRPAVAEAFSNLSVDEIQRLEQLRAHWVRPRWYETPQDWDRMIATAEYAEAARMPPVSMRILNRMFADLEPATCIEAQTRHL